MYCSLLNISFKNVAGKGTLNRDFASLPNNANFVKYASYKHNGFGSISYGIADFTSNYGNTLPTQDITSGSSTPVFAFSSNPAYKVSTPLATNLIANIEYDTAVSKYYAEVISHGQSTRLYFRGKNPESLPSYFSGSNTLLLYTGTRPIVAASLTMAENANLSDVRNNVARVNSAGMFNTTNWLVYNSSTVIRQTYSIFFTNVSQVSVAGSVNIRSLKMSPKPAYFTNAGRFYVGSFINSAGMLADNFVNVSYTNGSYRYPFTSFGTLDSVNPNQSVDSVNSANGADLKLYDTFICRNTQLGSIFNISLLKNLASQSYNVEINPASVQIYEAIDANRNGQLDINVAATNPANFGLNAAFSELLYTLTPVSANSKVNVPKVVDSWVLNREYRNIKGSSLDINMNVRWNVGYSVGNFFTIRQNNVAEFEVITVHTEYNSSANDKNMTNLVVSPVAYELFVGNRNSWAHAPSNSPLSGLAFKVNGKKIDAGDTVRLFVDNQVPANNTLSLAVGNKSYKLSSYDQERYAALLDEQIRFTNKLE